MHLHDAINCLVRKFGPRVKFTEVMEGCVYFTLGGHDFQVTADGELLEVEEVTECDVTDDTCHSRWLRAVVLGAKRNDAGEMVYE